MIFLNLAYWYRQLWRLERTPLTIETPRRLLILFLEKHHKPAVLMNYVIQGQILARALFDPVNRIVILIVLTAVWTAKSTTY